LRRAGPSYTFDTVTQLRSALGEDARLFWIVGADSLPELAGWSRVRQLVESVEIIVAARPGWEAPDLSALRAAIGDDAVETLLQRCLRTPRIEISASDIRARLATGRPVRYLLPDAVADYAIQHRLYKNG
jgi:nicotinate-nucleotide adenylyltransferase